MKYMKKINELLNTDNIILGAFIGCVLALVFKFVCDLFFGLVAYYLCGEFVFL